MTEFIVEAIKAVVQAHVGVELTKSKPMAMAMAAALIIPTSMKAIDSTNKIESE